MLAACGGRPTSGEFAAYEAMLKGEGRLRTERAPADAPYTRADLVRDFELVALRHEADSLQPGSSDNALPNPLQRWEGPIRYLVAGSAVTAADRAEVASLMGRIAELTGLDVAPADATGGANFLILITDPAERDSVSADLARSAPAFARTFELWRRHSELICVADNLFDRSGNVLVAALVVIGEETGGLLRRACLHEEIVQALGLANDHPAVRPSIFNDDGEFALLTEHDEQLLRILYDPRLRPGMDATEALPVVRLIVAELDVPEAEGRVAAAAMPAAAARASATRPH